MNKPEEEEVEELLLGTYALKPAQQHGGIASSSQAASSAAKGSQAVGDNDDEFGLNIAYVPAAKRAKMDTRKTAAASSSSVQTAKTTIGSAWESDTSHGLDVDRTANFPDDTDKPQDVKEFQLWKARRQRRLQKQ